jgi:hypothetical protein
MVKDPVEFGLLIKEDVKLLEAVIKHMASDIGSLLRQDHEKYYNIIQGENRGVSFRVPAHVFVPPHDSWQRIHRAVSGKLTFYSSCTKSGKITHTASSSAGVDKIQIAGRSDGVFYIKITATTSDNRIVFDYTSSMLKILKSAQT